MATALAVEACGRGRGVRFHRVTELITQLMEAREQGELGRLRKQLGRLDLLVLDELGYVPASKLGAELLFDVTSTAYERGSLIVTTNLPFENWGEVLGSERPTRATLGRLTHRCPILEANGESYRPRDAKRRRSRRAVRKTCYTDPFRLVTRRARAGAPRTARRRAMNRRPLWHAGRSHAHTLP
jgi:DNA replication protein DnaC